MHARGQVCFFVPYLSLASNGAHGTDDLYSFGKVVFLGVVGAVSLEVPAWQLRANNTPDAARTSAKTCCK